MPIGAGVQVRCEGVVPPNSQAMDIYRVGGFAGWCGAISAGWYEWGFAIRAMASSPTATIAPTGNARSHRRVTRLIAPVTGGTG